VNQRRTDIAMIKRTDNELGKTRQKTVPQNIHIKDRNPLKPGMTPDAHEGKQFLHHYYLT
jgi:hypothetical protein